MAVVSLPLFQYLPDRMCAVRIYFVAVFVEPQLESLALSGAGGNSECRNPMDSPKPLFHSL